MYCHLFQYILFFGFFVRLVSLIKKRADKSVSMRANSLFSSLSLFFCFSISHSVRIIRQADLFRITVRIQLSVTVCLTSFSTRRKKTEEKTKTKYALNRRQQSLYTQSTCAQSRYRHFGFWNWLCFPSAAVLVYVSTIFVCVCAHGFNKSLLSTTIFV